MHLRPGPTGSASCFSFAAALKHLLSCRFQSLALVGTGIGTWNYLSASLSATQKPERIVFLSSFGHYASLIPYLARGISYDNLRTRKLKWSRIGGICHQTMIGKGKRQTHSTNACTPDFKRCTKWPEYLQPCCCVPPDTQ
jgi:hypothetical protein